MHSDQLEEDFVDARKTVRTEQVLLMKEGLRLFRKKKDKGKTGLKK